MKIIIALLLVFSLCVGFAVTGFADLIDPFQLPVLGRGTETEPEAKSVIESVKDFFITLFNNIKDFFSAVAQRISELFGEEPEATV